MDDHPISRVLEGGSIQVRQETAISARKWARSASGGTRGRDAHELGDGFVGRQVLIGSELHGYSASLTSLRRRGAYYPSSTANRHALCQGDFRWHGEGQFHNRPFRERRLGVKENSTAADVLRETVKAPFLKLDSQRQVYFKTLGTPPLQSIEVGIHQATL